MRRADRLLQIIQILRRTGAPTTAAALAAELEVVPRTIYRDIVSLQASRVPIEGEAGIGYVLRGGYDLPPLMFNPGEIDAIVLGLAMVAERCDAELARHANDALAKVRDVIPHHSSQDVEKAHLLVPHPLAEGVSFGDHIAVLRAAIRDHRKVRIEYRDAATSLTSRTIWPLGLYLFSHVTVVGAWCELRGDYRAFRSERVEGCHALEDLFDARRGALMAEFVARFRARQRSRRSPHGEWEASGGAGQASTDPD